MSLHWRAFMAVCWLSAACQPEDILLATVSDAGLDGGAQDAGSQSDAADGSCRNSGDCDPSSLCEKSSCDAALGQCARRPVVCGPDPSPVCGCDGLTYFNDCLRRSVGAGAATRDECGQNAILCGGPQAVGCPPFASCGKLGNVGASCSDFGLCWVLPNRCSDGLRDEFAPCFDGPNEPCVSACAAIESEEPHVRSMRCR